MSSRSSTKTKGLPAEAENKKSSMLIRDGLHNGCLEAALCQDCSSLWMPAQGWGSRSPAYRLSEPSQGRHATPSVPSKPQGAHTDCHCARYEVHLGHFKHPREPQGPQMAPGGGYKGPARLFGCCSLVTQPCAQRSSHFLQNAWKRWQVVSPCNFRGFFSPLHCL